MSDYLNLGSRSSSPGAPGMTLVGQSRALNVPFVVSPARPALVSYRLFLEAPVGERASVQLISGTPPAHTILAEFERLSADAEAFVSATLVALVFPGQSIELSTANTTAGAAVFLEGVREILL